MRRREFIAGLGSAVAWPLGARAQQGAMPVIGFLSSSSPGVATGSMRWFLEGLRDTGYVEGRNVAFEYRWAEEHNDRLPVLAADLVRSRVSAIFAGGVPSVAAAKAATATIPIVFTGGFDPVAVGFVASLARPGGNLTGVTSLTVELAPKRLELLHVLAPMATSIALLVDPANPVSAETQWKGFQDAARILGLEPHLINASSERDFENVFATVAQLRAGGLVIANTSLFLVRAEQLGALTLRHAVPTIFESGVFAAAGGLMSYGDNNFAVSSRLAGIYVGRILKGEKPSDLPVQQSAAALPVISGGARRKPIRGGLCVSSSAIPQEAPRSLMGQWLPERLGQQFIIENRPAPVATSAPRRSCAHPRTAILFFSPLW
jgi:putative tryptophan/tyrosine transport system substrate-binding protein